MCTVIKIIIFIKTYTKYPLPAFLLSQYDQNNVFIRSCTFEDDILIFKDDQVNAKYISRATLLRFFVNYAVYTSQLNKCFMHYQGIDNDKTKHVFHLVLCANKSNLNQQNFQC